MIEALHRAEWGRLLSALIRAVGDFDVAEEALQEAFAAAVVAWSPPAAAPRNPRGWLYGTARHKAIDKLRSQARMTAMAADGHGAEEKKDRFLVAPDSRTVPALTDPEAKAYDAPFPTPSCN